MTRLVDVINIIVSSVKFISQCLILVAYYDYVHANVMTYLFSNGEIVYFRIEGLIS